MGLSKARCGPPKGVEQSCYQCMHMIIHEAQMLACCQMYRVLNALLDCKRQLKMRGY